MPDDALERVYERLLLGMATEAMGGELTITRGFDPGTVYAEDTSGHGLRRGEGHNLADALAALLHDLGVEDVPERVSAEEVREALERIVVDAANVFPRNALGSVPFALERLRMLYASGNRGALLAESILVVGL